MGLIVFYLRLLITHRLRPMDNIRQTAINVIAALLLSSDKNEQNGQDETIAGTDRSDMGEAAQEEY